MAGTESAVRITDVDGCSYPAEVVDGLYVLLNSTKQWRDSTKAFAARESDVYIASYPKSGLHWIWEIVRMLVNRTADVPESNMVSNWIELPSMTREVFDQLPSPRVIASHRYFADLPRDATRRRCKIVYMERYLKDCAVAYYNMYSKLISMNYQGTWPAFAQLFLRGQVLFNSWFTFVKDWRHVMEKNPEYPIYRIRYENLKADPANEIRKLANFLEVPADKKLIEDIVRETDFEPMKRRKDEMSKDFNQYYKDGKPIIYRKGEVGDWKNWFTVAQSEQWDAEYVSQMGRHHNGQGDY